MPPSEHSGERADSRRLRPAPPHRGSPRPDRARATRLRFLDDLAYDARFGARGLVRNSGFAAMAIAVLALAIGANAAIFALVDLLMLRPTGLRDPAGLVRVFSRNTVEPDTYRSFSYPDYVALRDGAPVLDELAAFLPALVGLEGGDGTTRREFAQLVSASYFSALGAEPAMGRSFLAEEEKPGAEIRAVVISHALWARSGADPEPLGKPLEINGEPYTVVGVAPPGFGGVNAVLTTDVFLPLGVYGTSVSDMMGARGGDLADRDRRVLMLIGRLRPGFTPASAMPELAAVSARMAADDPAQNRDFALELGPQPRVAISDRPVKDTAVSVASAVMMAMAGIVLLVACLNLANMFLARGAARRTEIAIRQSLGGSRGRILRQLLTEGLLVSLAGGAGGVLVGVWAARWVVASIVPLMPFGGFALNVELGPRVIAATLAFCGLSTLLFGLGPSLALVRSAVVDDLKDAIGRHSGGRRAGRGRRLKPGSRRLMPRNGLVVAQIALSLALVTAAGLFVRSAVRAGSYRPEFRVEGVHLIEIDGALRSLDEDSTRALFRQVLERLRGQPGVESVALASNVPFSSLSEGDAVRMTGAPEDAQIDAEQYVVTGGYFETMGLAVLRGRDFDQLESEPGASAAVAGGAVAIVDEPLARRLRADGDVIGRSLVLDTPRAEEPSQILEIVGVVPGVRRALFDRDAEPTLYLPFGRFHRSRMLVHLHADHAAVLETAAREIRSIDPQMPILSMKTMRGHLDQGIERWLVRTGASVFAALGGVAVLLALVGVYGVKAYLVARRTREIGIRMALGATPRDVLRWMMRDGLASTLAGLGLGIVLALGLGRVLSSVLYGIGGLDLLTFVVAPALLALAALLAAYLPSRRATRLAPAAALREE